MYGVRQIQRVGAYPRQTANSHPICFTFLRICAKRDLYFAYRFRQVTRERLFLRQRRASFRDQTFMFFCPSVHAEPFYSGHRIPTRDLYQSNRLSIRKARPINLRFFTNCFFVINVPRNSNVNTSNRSVQIIHVFRVDSPFRRCILPQPMSTPIHGR